MELVKISGNTFYFNNASIIGLYRLNDEEVVLIDTGIDDDSAKKVMKIINEKQWRLTDVINTHSHADHCGGNNLIQKRINPNFYASRIEKSYIESPSIEPHYLYGAYPPKLLRAKFLQAKSSNVQNVLEVGQMELKGQSFEIVDLKGHSPGQIGILTPDHVLFLGDTVISKEVIGKYALLYNYCLRDLFDSIEKLKNFDVDYYVLSHGGVCKNIDMDIEENLKALDGLNNYLMEILEEPLTKEGIHQSVSSYYQIKENIPIYYLNDSLISSHLSYLIQENKIQFGVVEGRVIYKKIIF